MMIRAAETILSQEGLAAVTIRAVASAIGYTSGTLYQIFRNRDALVLEVHVRTLNGLYEDLESRSLPDEPEAALVGLANGCIDYARRNPNRWTALFEHTLPPGEELPPAYDEALFRLVGLAAEILRPVVPGNDPVLALHEARVLWASFYGIVTLDTSDKLSRFEGIDSFITSLARNYVAGLKANLRE